MRVFGGDILPPSGVVPEAPLLLLLPLRQSPPPKPLRLVRGEGLSLTLFEVVEDLLSVLVGDDDDFDGEEGEEGDFAATTSVLF